MLTEIDRQNLIEFGKQWRESADNNKEKFKKQNLNTFIEKDLQKNFLVYFKTILKFVSKEDDGEIDTIEEELLQWADEFTIRVAKEGKEDFNTEIGLIRQGFDEA